MLARDEAALHASATWLGLGVVMSDIVEAFVIVNNPGPSSDVTILDWIPASDERGIERLRDRYAKARVEGDEVTEHRVRVDLHSSHICITADLYALFSR